MIQHKFTIYQTYTQVLDAKEEWNREEYKQKDFLLEKQNYNINSSRNSLIDKHCSRIILI